MSPRRRRRRDDDVPGTPGAADGGTAGAPRTRARRGRRGRGAGPRPARLSPADRLRVGASGLRARPTRVILSALGIAIGIAAMVAVVGISTSSRAELDARLDQLGTNLIRVSPGETFFGEDSKLPPEAVQRVDRLDAVEGGAQVELVSGTGVYRNDQVPRGETGGLRVYAADLNLLDVLRVEVRSGRWLSEASTDHPTVVLGAIAAEHLGVTEPTPDTLVRIGDEYFGVVGILERSELLEEINFAALVGHGVAREALDAEGHASTIYARVDPERVEESRELVGRSANPESPNEVDVSRPSDALEAQQAIDQTFTGLLVGLGGVALLVGGVGVANTMVISVLERRGEIGLRRALGATRRDIRSQFLVEAMSLSALGGVGGVVLGSVTTAIYALTQGWPVAIPVWAVGGAVAATVVIGAVAGIIPALRAASQDPTHALGTG